MDYHWVRDACRRIHLDFHTGDLFDEKIDRFNAKGFTATVAAANAEAITIFAKCHYGNSYYDTKVGRKHPGLREDMLAELVPRLHDAGIKVAAYYSVCADFHAAVDHPDWQQVDNTGNPGNSEFMREVCLNSPYMSDLMLPQILEVVSNCDVDGIWLDIVGIGSGKCFCNFCRELYRERYGESMDLDSARLEEFRVETVQEAIGTIRREVHKIRPGLPIAANGGGAISDFGAAATLSRRRADGLVDISAIEACPGYDNYYYVGYQARYARKLGRPYELINSRFVHLWGEWTAKPVEQMKYEAAIMLASGGKVTFGDQAYPDGSLDKNLYLSLGEVFSFVREREPYVRGTKVVSDTAVLFADGESHQLKGADAICCDLNLQHDLIDEPGLGDLSGYDLLIVPEVGQISGESRTRILEFVKRGGLLLATGSSNLEEVSGVAVEGISLYSLGYLPAETLANPGIPMLVKSRPYEAQLVNAELLVPWQLPDYELGREELIFRSPSPGRMSNMPAIAMRCLGRGKVIYIAADIFSTFWTTNHWWLRDVVGYCLNELGFEPLVEVESHGIIRTSLRGKDEELFLHMIPFQPGPSVGGGYPCIERATPLHDVRVALRTGVKPSSMTLEPGGKPLRFHHDGRYSRTTIDTLSEYSVLRLDFHRK